jgi:homoserine kinase
MVVRAPATSANLGPGFDSAAVALELWNELEVSDGDTVVVEGEGAGELPEDETNLAVRAYALAASPAGKRFRFVNRIPLGSGLGSSAAAIALGLVAAAPEAPAEELLRLGLELEAHADNLAAALTGGVTLTWEGRIARVADDLPLAPVVVIPATRTDTGEARAALPGAISHADAAHTAGRAALLGAALAAGDAEWMAAALDDRLHEPYRPSPLLAAIRAELPRGAAGATLSGSGPTVVVWARDAEACAEDLRQRFPEHRVLRLDVARGGALQRQTPSGSVPSGAIA